MIDISNAQSCIMGVLMMMFGYGVRSKFDGLVKSRKTDFLPQHIGII